jgi:hypothetical protein
VSEATQAAYLTLAMQCVEQDAYVQVAIWHIYRNPGSSDTWFDQLGLVRTGFSRSSPTTPSRAIHRAAPDAHTTFRRRRSRRPIPYPSPRLT